MTRPVLGRLTTEYLEREDRLRISGQIQSGEVQVFWLTLRLLNRLMPVLTRWLEQQGSTSPHAELLHSWAQSEARAGLGQEAPVAAASAVAQCLVDSVDIRYADERIELVFHGHGTPVRAVLPSIIGPVGGAAAAMAPAGKLSASLVLDSRQLRQWLAILRDAYRKADWPVEAWPSWMLSDGSSPGAARPTLH